MWKHFFRSCISRKSLIPSERSVFRGLLSHPWFRKFENITPGWKSFGQTPKTFTGDKEILARPRKSGLVKMRLKSFKRRKSIHFNTGTRKPQAERQAFARVRKDVDEILFQKLYPWKSMICLVSHPWFSKFANIKKFYRIRS